MTSLRALFKKRPEVVVWGPEYPAMWCETCGAVFLYTQRPTIYSVTNTVSRSRHGEAEWASVELANGRTFTVNHCTECWAKCPAEQRVRILEKKYGHRADWFDFKAAAEMGAS